MCVCGQLSSCRKAGSSSSKCLSYHTHMHTHNVTDTFPPTAMMSQADSCRKLLASSQPHFSSNGFLSQLHPPLTPDICQLRILHFYIPLVFPLSLPSFPHPSLFLSLNVGCALSMKGQRKRWMEGKLDTRKEAGLVWQLFPGDIKEGKYRIILYLTVFSLNMELNVGKKEEGCRDSTEKVDHNHQEIPSPCE